MFRERGETSAISSATTSPTDWIRVTASTDSHQSRHQRSRSAQTKRQVRTRAAADLEQPPTGGGKQLGPMVSRRPAFSVPAMNVSYPAANIRPQRLIDENGKTHHRCHQDRGRLVLIDP
jgi:hypothetical protein